MGAQDRRPEESYRFCALTTIAPLLLLIALTAGSRPAAAESPDFVLSHDDIGFSRLDAIAEEPILVLARVTNIGNVGGNATIRFQRAQGGNPTPVPLGESLVHIPAGSATVASASATLPAGLHVVSVAVGDVVPGDADLSNNVASTTFEVFASEGLVRFSTPTLLVEGARVTLQGGAERVIPFNVTVLGGRAMGITLRVWDSSGAFAEPANSPFDANPGQVVQVFLRISAPVSEGVDPSERMFLVQAVGSNARGNVAAVSLFVHPPVASGSWWDSTAAALAAAGALGTLLGALHAVEPSRYKLLGLILPLYTRLRKEAVLDQYTRGKIHGYLVANPGDYFTAIGRALGISAGNLAYHLRVLEREGQIVSARDGAWKRFYPRGARTELSVEGGLPPVQKAIRSAVRETPGIRQKEIASLLGLTSSTVSYHLQKLVARGMVAAERKGMSVRYFPKADAARTSRAGDRAASES